MVQLKIDLPLSVSSQVKHSSLLFFFLYSNANLYSETQYYIYYKEVVGMHHITQHLLKRDVPKCQQIYCFPQTIDMFIFCRHCKLRGRSCSIFCFDYHNMIFKSCNSFFKSFYKCNDLHKPGLVFTQSAFFLSRNAQQFNCRYFKDSLYFLMKQCKINKIPRVREKIQQSKRLLNVKKLEIECFYRQVVGNPGTMQKLKV